MPASRAETIALNMINGNRSDARRVLLNSHGKAIVIEVIDELAQYHGSTLRAVEDVRSLLRGAR